MPNSSPTGVRHSKLVAATGRSSSASAPELLSQANAGYTCVPNDFFDNLAPDLRESELRVMLYLYRHTLGFHKLTDRISYDQFLTGIVTSREGRRLDRGAGVSRRSLVTALAALESKGLITRDHTSGKHAPARYSVVIHQKDLQTVDKEAGSVQNLPPLGTEQVIEQPADESMGVQEMHSTIEISHDNMKDSGPGQPVTLSVEEGGESKIQAPTFNECVEFLVDKVPGLLPRDARRLTQIALHRHGRDYAYLAALVEHVTTNPAIRVPAAVLTVLISSNEVRTVSGERANERGKGRVRPVCPPDRGARGGYPRTQTPLDMSKFEPGGKYAFLVGPVTT